MSKLYAQYRILAAANRLIDALGVQIATEARMDQRQKFDVNPIPPEDRQENSFPYPRMGPPVPDEDPSPYPTGSN
jgi:adhesin transport system outer membrane protein